MKRVRNAYKRKLTSKYLQFHVADNHKTLADNKSADIAKLSHPYCNADIVRYNKSWKYHSHEVGKQLLVLQHINTSGRSYHFIYQTFEENKEVQWIK